HGLSPRTTVWVRAGATGSPATAAPGEPAGVSCTVGRVGAWRPPLPGAGAQVAGVPPGLATGLKSSASTGSMPVMGSTPLVLLVVAAGDGADFVRQPGCTNTMVMTRTWRKTTTPKIRGIFMT